VTRSGPPQERERRRPPSAGSGQRRALGFLFAGLATGLTVVAAAALTSGDGTRHLLVGVAAAALAAWLASLSAAAFRRPR